LLVLVAVIGVLAVGFVATGPDFRVLGVKPGVDSIIGNSIRAYVGFYQRATSIPEVCWSGNAVNEFQVRQCSEFWTQLALSAGLLLVPLVAVAFVWTISTDFLSGVYRRARKRVEAGKLLGVGVVTDPAIAAGDKFSYFFCLQVISVQLVNKQQIRVYIPLNASVPMPGQQLALFDGGRVFGARRYWGILYAPHIAVVRGA